MTVADFADYLAAKLELEAKGLDNARLKNRIATPDLRTEIYRALALFIREAAR